MSKPKKKPQTAGVTRIKAACGHLVSYPSPWNQFVKRGRGYITLESCPCGYGHVIVIQKSGVDVLTTDNPQRARKMMWVLPFEYRMWTDERGRLMYKRFDETNTDAITDFMEQFSRIPPPKTNSEIQEINTIRNYFAFLLK